MKSNNPVLRFHEFHENWVSRSIEELAKEFLGGGTPKTTISEFWNGEIPWIQSSDLTNHKVYGVTSKKNINSFAIKNSATKIIPKDSIAIVTRVGVGKIALFEHPYSTSQDFLSLSELNIDKWFGVYLLYNKLQKELKQVQGTSIKGITKSELLRKNVSLPEINEQIKLGDFFKKLDDTISLHQQELEALNQTKQGFLQKMFPKDGETEPAVRFEKYTEKWQLKKLGDILKVNSGRDYKHLGTGNIPVYGTGGFMLNVNESLSNEDAIGLGRKGTIDKPQLLRAPFWTVDTLFFMTMKKDIDLYFCYSLINMIPWKKYDESTGVPSLSKTNIDKILVKVPSHEEQIKIGEFFRRLDEVIELKEKEIEALKETKKGFLQKMFV